MVVLSSLTKTAAVVLIAAMLAITPLIVLAQIADEPTLSEKQISIAPTLSDGQSGSNDAQLSTQAESARRPQRQDTTRIGEDVGEDLIMHSLQLTIDLTEQQLAHLSAVTGETNTGLAARVAIQTYLDGITRATESRPQQSTKILWLNAKSQKVWIGLGAADGLKRQMVFDVYAAGARSLQQEQSKGKIEVTRILDRHLAEGRIVTQQQPESPILPGDRVHSTGGAARSTESSTESETEAGANRPAPGAADPGSESLGSDDGLRVGHTLIVFRDSAYLGRLTVERVLEDRSVARVESRRGNIRRGDRIATESRPANEPATRG